MAADIWTLGVSLYEILGERALFESFSWDQDNILADMISTLGDLPARWWDKWEKRSEFFTPDGSWLREIKRIYTPGSRPLNQRMWDMGRGEAPETCQWDVERGEMRTFEELLRGMLNFEPGDRWRQIVGCAAHGIRVYGQLGHASLGKATAEAIGEQWRTLTTH